MSSCLDHVQLRAERREAAPRRAWRSATLLACLLLPSCMTSALWRDDDQVQVLVAREHGAMAIDTVGFVDEKCPDPSVDVPSVLVCSRPVRGGPDLLGGKSTKPVWMLFQPEDQQAAGAIAAILASEPLGPVDRCIIELDLTRSVSDEDYLTAHVEIGGKLAPRICNRMLDEASAEQLLGSPRGVDVARLEAGRWSACVDAAERVDWHVLLQFAPDGHGVVMGGLEDGDDMELVVHVGNGPHSQYLRVPAAVTPVLCCVQRDWSSPWGERYLLQTGGNVRVMRRPMSSVAMGPPLRPTAMVFTDTVEGMRPRYTLLEKILFTPIAVAVDVGAWILQHGPLAPLWGHDEPATPDRHRRGH
jgi:hypothetical protein